MKRLLFIAMAMAFGTISTSAQNLISNPNFNSASANIGTGYLQSCTNTQTLPALWPEGTYCIATNPHSKHPNWTSIGDHTTGTGNMLIVNGNTPATTSSAATVDIVWSQTVTGLTIGHAYKFQFFAKSIHPTNPAKLSAFAYDTSLQLKATPDTGHVPIFSGTSYTLSADTTKAGGWIRILSAFIANSTSVKLIIMDSSLIANGNDFALDDLSLVLSNNTTLPIYIKELKGVATNSGVNINWTVSKYNILNLQFSKDGSNWENVYTDFAHSMGSYYHQFVGKDNYFRLQVFETAGALAEYSNTLYFASKVIQGTNLQYYNNFGNRIETEPASGEYFVRDNITGLTQHNYKQ